MHEDFIVLAIQARLRLIDSDAGCEADMMIEVR